jgi:c-di-GMP phosphodiesterase
MDVEPLLSVVPLVTRTLDIAGYDLSLLNSTGERAPGGGVVAVVARIAQQAPRFWRDRAAIADCGQVECAQPPHCTTSLLLSMRRADIADPVQHATRRWRQAGFGLCLDVTRLTDWTIDLLAQADLLRFPLEKVGAAERMRQFPARHVLIAGHSLEAFARGHSAQFHLFQGHFFTEPLAGTSAALPASYANIVQLIRLVQGDAPLQRLEEVLKRDPALSFRLLRYINSAGFGLSCEIQSFKHAVTVLGYGPLRKWLALLLITAARQRSSAALATAAVCRGRLAELIGGALDESVNTDELFIAGAFSLLHVIVGAPLTTVMEELPVPDLVSDALLRGAGPYAPIVELVAVCERLAQPHACEQADELCASLALSHLELNKLQADALAWAENLAD